MLLLISITITRCPTRPRMGKTLPFLCMAACMCRALSQPPILKMKYPKAFLAMSLRSRTTDQPLQWQKFILKSEVKAIWFSLTFICLLKINSKRLPHCLNFQFLRKLQWNKFSLWKKINSNFRSCMRGPRHIRLYEISHKCHKFDSFCHSGYPWLFNRPVVMAIRAST